MLKTDPYQCRSQGQPMVLRVYFLLVVFLCVAQAISDAIRSMLIQKIIRLFQVFANIGRFCYLQM